MIYTPACGHESHTYRVHPARPAMQRVNSYKAPGGSKCYMTD